MNVVGNVLFDLLVGAFFAFASSCLIVFAVKRACGIRHGRLALAMLMIPLVKVALGLARGVPSGAFLWARTAGVTRDLGTYQIGFGVERPLLPLIGFELGALAHGRQYLDSAADVLAAFLARRVSPFLPAALGFALLGLGLASVAAGMIRLSRGAPRRSTLAREADQLAILPLGLRRVPVWVTTAYDGPPFAAGILRPYICFPRRLYEELPPEERRAVLLHELAHLRSLDLLVVGSVEVMRAFFWFVPGMGALAREVRAQCELLADASAVSLGASPLALGSAMVRVAEIEHDERRARPGAVLGFSFEALLSRRVRHLLAPSISPRYVSVLRLSAVALAGSAVWHANLLGYPCFLGHH